MLSTGAQILRCLKMLLHAIQSQHHSPQSQAQPLLRPGVCRRLSTGDGRCQAGGARTWKVAQNGGAVLGGFRQAAVALAAWSMVCVWVPSILPPSPIRMWVGAQGSRLYLYTLFDLCKQARQS